MPKKKRGKKGKGDDDDYDALFDDQVRLRAQIKSEHSTTKVCYHQPKQSRHANMYGRWRHAGRGGLQVAAVQRCTGMEET